MEIVAPIVPITPPDMLLIYSILVIAKYYYWNYEIYEFYSKYFCSVFNHFFKVIKFRDFIGFIYSIMC